MAHAAPESNPSLRQLRAMYRRARRESYMGVTPSPELRHQRVCEIAPRVLKLEWSKRLQVVAAFGALIDAKFADEITAKLFALTHRPGLAKPGKRAKALRLRDPREMRAA
jgi:hypothetical protein